MNVPKQNIHMSEKSLSKWSARTKVAQALGTIDEVTRAVVPPITVATTYIRDPDNAYRSGNVYGRPDNANVRHAEAILGMLEGAPVALLFGSGMSAATAVCLALSPGDHVVAPKVMYWALRAWMLRDLTRLGIDVTFVDAGDLGAVQAAMKPGVTKLVWLESPGNPLWSVPDIRAIAGIAHTAGARLAVDSTCATPLLTRPLELGADIVMHSATKYLNGHSDVIAGALAAAKDDDFWQRIVRVRSTLGQILGPFEAYLLIRGMRTLPLRFAAACTTAMSLATRLSSHPCVAEVLYPGLPSHPDHAIASRQMHGGFGGMLSIRTGSEETAIATAAHVQLWKRATSLGGVESLIEHRRSVEGEDSPCPADLLRLSVGIEDADDLFTDLDQALRTARSAR